MTQTTILHDRHEKLGARIVDFHGWMLPVQYEGVLAEHKHCRSAAVVFDTGHMGQFLCCGSGGAAELGSVCTQNAQALKVGRSRYGFLLNEQGGVRDDTILMRLGEEEFLLVVNAGTLESDLKWLMSHLTSAVALRDLTASGWAKIDLQGPRAYEALAPRVTAGNPGAMGYFGVGRYQCLGRDCIISRTGYTGELGYEIMADGEDLVAIFDQLMAIEWVKPAGLGARDSLRMEMCYPLYGEELTPAHTPLEAGLDIFLPSDHEFIGWEALQAQAAQGVSRSLVAFQSASRRKTNPGDKILFEGNEVGVVTSGGFAPSLEVSAGLGYVAPHLTEPGRELIVSTGRAEIPVTVCEKPLYKQGTCRRKDVRG